MGGVSTPQPAFSPSQQARSEVFTASSSSGFCLLVAHHLDVPAQLVSGAQTKLLAQSNIGDHTP